MSKFIHGTSMAGQSVVDRVLAAKHTVAGQSLAKVTCKATTEEVMGPKRKHLDYLLQCTNEPNVSVPEMANLLIERTQNTNWVVVFKALITVHNLMNYGNERFTQYLASNNCTFNLTSFTDRTGTQGYDMSSYIRRYAKYLNEKAFSYRQMAFDFCKVKRGKEDGMLRTMNTEKLLKTLPVLQSQLDALVEFDVTANELTNGVINAAFMLLFKDLIRLFACYNDGVINLLEKYFEMNKKNCREALDIYKKFLARMDRVCEFLKVAESVGIDKGDIPDLAKAPASLLEALEQHLASLESSKKGTNAAPPKPASGVSTVISNYAAAAQIGAAPGAGAGVTHISDEERQRILEEEQRQLDQMKQQRMKQMAASSSSSSSPANAASSTAAGKPATSSSKVSSPPRPSDHLSSVGNNSSGPSLADDLFSLSAAPPPQQSAPFGSSSSFGASASLDSMFMTSSAPAPQLSYSANPSPMFGASAAFQPSPFGNASAFAAPPVQTSNPFVSAPAPVMVMPQTWGSPAFMGTQGSMMTGPSIVTPNHAGIDAKFAAAFNNSSSSGSSTQKTGYDGFGEILQPLGSGGGGAAVDMSGGMSSRGSVGSGLGGQQNASGADKLIKSDLDSSLALLAGNLSIRPSGQVKKTDHQWSGTPGEKRLTGAGTTWNQPAPANPAGFPVQMNPMYAKPMMTPNNNQFWVVGGMPAGQPMMMTATYPAAPMGQPVMMGQPTNMVAGGWPSAQPQMFGATQQTPQHSTAQPRNTANDPFGAL